MGSGDVVNQLLNQNGFAYAGAAEQADFTTLCVGADQVDNLNAGFQNFGSGLLLLVGGSGAVDGPDLLRLNRGLVINGLTQQIEYTSQTFLTHGNRDGSAGIGGLGASLQTVSGGHGDAANQIVANVLSNLSHNGLVAIGDFDGAEQLGKLIVAKSNIKNRAHYLNHSSYVFGHGIQLLVLKFGKEFGTL